MSGRTIDESDAAPASATTELNSGPTPAVDSRERARARGESIGRYLVLERIGAGGMGVVYAAYDPTLDRRVALKLLHPKSGAGGDYQVRLLREAQAMAKLSNPNVVTVHGVEVVDDQVVLAMEYVPGMSLDRWLDTGSGPRPWRDVLDMFIGAGTGLAAAHAAGIVHRDFKPSNVLVGDDGRARVTDFGLARPHGDADVASADATESPALQTPMTQTGAVLGTPAYMAPEQHVGEPADARADQFAFCVSLYEGLYGERPFGGASPALLLQEIERHNVREAPSDSRVPRWLRGAVLRGLAAKRDERYGSMDELLAELTRDRSSRVAKALAFAIVVAGIAVVVNLATRPAPASAPDVCAAAADPIASVWNDDVSARVRTELVGTKLRYAAEVADTVIPRVAGYAKRWAEMRRQNCEATRVRGEQSESLMDRRTLCLDAQLQSLGALVAVLTDKPDKKTVDRAINLVGKLPRTSYCADTKTLLLAVPPPQDPGVREKILTYERRIADIDNLTSLGKFKSGLKRASALAEEVASFPYAKTRALALYHKAYALSRLGKPAAIQAFERALVAAHEGHLVRTIRTIWIAMVDTLGTELDKPKQALALLPYVEAAIAGAPDPELHRGSLLVKVCAVRAESGDHAGAFKDCRRALDILADKKNTERASIEALSTLTKLYMGQRKLAKARKTLEQLVPLVRRIYGEKHMVLAQVYGNMGTLALRNKERAKAQELMEKSLAIKRAVLEPEHPSVLTGRANLATLRALRGEVEQATRELEALVKIYERVHGPNHTDTAFVLQQLADAYSQQPKFRDKAIAALRRALAIERKLRGDKHPKLAKILLTLSRLYWGRNAYDEQLAAARQAIAIWRPKRGDNFWGVGIARARIGQALVGKKQYAAAIAPLEQAYKVFAKYKIGGFYAGDMELALAKALWLTGRDRKRARGLFKSARKLFADAHKPALARRVDTWVAAHVR